MQITPSFQLPEIYQKMNIKVELPEAIPVEAKNRPLEAENIILQITKTNNTPYQFKNIKVNLDDGLFLPYSTLTFYANLVEYYEPGEDVPDWK